MVDEDNYLLHLSRYIHQNPTLTKGYLNQYPYSSYSDYIGEKKTPWLNTDFTLDFFKGTKSEELKLTNFANYKEFVENYDQEPEEIIGKLTIETDWWTTDKLSPCQEFGRGLVDYEPVKSYVRCGWGVDLYFEGLASYFFDYVWCLAAGAGGSGDKHSGFIGYGRGFDHDFGLSRKDFGCADRAFGFAVIVHPGVGTFI